MEISFDPGSFKDNEGRIFYQGDRVFRTMQSSANTRVQKLFSTGVIDELVKKGWLIPSSRADQEKFPFNGKAPAGLLEHAKIPVVTYVYEWPFEALKDAALLTLDLMLYLVPKGYILKDATPYNYMFYDGKLQLIDLLSVDDIEDGAPWVAYAQFCREMLFPLMIQAYKGIDFRVFMRGNISGVTAETTKSLFSFRDKFRPGVLTNVVLQAKLDQSFSNSNAQVKKAVSNQKLSRTLMLGMIQRLRNLVAGLKIETGSHWSDYAQNNSYQDTDRQEKHDFIEEFLKGQKPKQLVDLGANTGEYTFLALKHTDRVVSVDIDPMCINNLYLRMKAQGEKRIVPIAANLLDPSPALGWNNKERRDLFARVKSDSFVALALIHHICISGNVPVENFVALLPQLGNSGVVEWVDKKDSMVQKLLCNRKDVFDDYTWEHFEASVRRHFEIVKIKDIMGGGRKLVWVRGK